MTMDSDEYEILAIAMLALLAVSALLVFVSIATILLILLGVIDASLSIAIAVLITFLINGSIAIQWFLEAA